MKKYSHGKKRKKVYLPHDKLRDALFNVQDMLERSMISFILLDDTAKQVKEDQKLKLEEISVGILKKDLTQSGFSMLRSLVSDLYVSDDNLSYKYKGVTIVIWIIHRNYKFFQAPDTVFYEIENFRIPNPFKQYYNARYLVK